MTATASWFHVSVKTMSRSTGRSVVAAAAYRLGTNLHEQEVDQVHDYRRRSGVAVTFTCAPADAPEWAHDPERLWNAANAAEKRKNSTLAREIELALPAAVDAKAREDIARAVAQELVNRYGVVVSGAIHEPSRSGDQRNHHAHLLFTTRRMESEGLTTKTRVLDAKATGPQEVTYLRGFTCDLINAALEEAGSDERVDHRSFATRGIEQEPTEHLGPGGTALERRAEQSGRGLSDYEIVGGNQRFHELVDQLAALDAEIAAEQERLLDARFGPAEPDPPSPEPSPPSPLVEPHNSPPEQAGSGMGFAERTKRAFASFFGKRTDASVAIDPSAWETPGVSDDPLVVAEPTGDEVSVSLISLGSQWTSPEPSFSPARVISGAGEGALAAFFREPPIVIRTAHEAPAEVQQDADLSSEPAAPLAAMPEAAAILPDTFAAVHNEAISQAESDQAMIDKEDVTGGQFERAQTWWANMREHFVEWRDHLQERFYERVESIRGRWEAPEPKPEQRHPELPMGPEP
jgi:hypothetical protein